MRRRIMATAFISALALAACGGDDGDDSATPGGEDGPIPISVGVIPIVDVAPIHLGVEQGFFEEEGLDVELVAAQGGAAIIPGVISGEFQFGFSNVTSLLLASGEGLPLRIVAPGNSTTGDVGEDFSAIVTTPDSGITSAADLEGRTVAINTLNNIADSVTRELVRRAGSDPAQIEFVELAFPDMPAALANEQVDAAFLLEPFLTVALEQGREPIAWGYAEVDPDLMIAAYFTSDDYVAQEPEIVDAFTSAMQRSLAYAEENPDEARATLGTYTDIEEELREAIVMPRFEPEVNVDTVGLLAELAHTDGLLAEPLDVSELIR